MTTTEFDGGASLRERRKAAGLTVAALAGAAGCSPSYIENVERGYRPRTSPVIGSMYAAIERQRVEAERASR